MARAIWSGAISFGLVNIPVKLYSAARKKTVRFHQLDSADNSRIQQKRVNPNTGEEVPYEQLVKGYELSPDRYVVVRPEELEAIEPKKTRTIDIEDFVELEQIDPIYFDHPYYLAPAEGAAKAYALLLQAMRDSGKVGIARVVIRSKEQLVAIRTRDNVLVMETLLFGDEVVPPSDLGELPAVEELEAGKREVDMARQLIESLATDFDPDRYRDEYRQTVLDLIERKAEGHEVAIQTAPEAPEEVPDLMAALEASIAAAKRQGGTAKDGAKDKPKAKRGSGAGGNGSKPRGKGASGAKSAPKKSKRTAAKK
jgi:DNA end-binding protein Ku